VNKYENIVNLQGVEAYRGGRPPVQLVSLAVVGAGSNVSAGRCTLTCNQWPWPVAIIHRTAIHHQRVQYTSVGLFTARRHDAARP